MGKISQTGLVNTVNIGGGGSSGGGEALILGACLLVGAWMVLGVAAALISALTILLIWMSVVLGLAIVLAVALGIVFRKRLKAHYGGPRLIVRGDSRPMPPPRPVSSPASVPTEVIHRHYHVIESGPRHVMPSLADLVEREVVEAEILP